MVSTLTGKVTRVSHHSGVFLQLVEQGGHWISVSGKEEEEEDCNVHTVLPSSSFFFLLLLLLLVFLICVCLCLIVFILIVTLLKTVGVAVEAMRHLSVWDLGTDRKRNLIQEVVGVERRHSHCCLEEVGVEQIPSVVHQKKTSGVLPLRLHSSLSLKRRRKKKKEKEKKMQ
jgi:hypothetical protein